MDEAFRPTAGLLSSVVRLKWAVITVTLLGGMLGHAYAAQQPTLYSASSTLLLSDPRTQTVLSDVRVSGSDPSRYVRNQARLATSQPVLQRAGQLLNRPSASLAVSAQALLDVDVIVVEAVSEDPELAAATADAVAIAYEQVRTEQAAQVAAEAIEELRAARAEVERQLVAVQETLAANPGAPAAVAERDAATQQLQVLLTRERQLAVDTALFGGGVEVREPAAVPLSPFQPQPRRYAAAGLLLGLVLASAVAWAWSVKRPGSVPRSHAESVLRVPQLGEVPRFARHLGPLPAAIDPLSVEAEAYQFLTAALVREMGKRHARTLLVTSATPGDGKTATVVNLAIVAARDGHSVVLVDADVRARGLSTLTGVVPTMGLEEIARESVPIQRCLVTPDVEGMEDLRVAGMDPDDVSENPAWFLRSPGFGHALQRLGQLADLVVVDSPPILAVADTFEMVPYVDAVLLVVGAATTDEDLLNVKRRLDLAGAQLIGYVLNRSGSRPGAYEYGGGYRSSAASLQRPAALPPAVRTEDDRDVDAGPGTAPAAAPPPPSSIDGRNDGRNDGRAPEGAPEPVPRPTA